MYIFVNNVEATIELKLSKQRYRCKGKHELKFGGNNDRKNLGTETISTL